MYRIGRRGEAFESNREDEYYCVGEREREDRIQKRGTQIEERETDRYIHTTTTTEKASTT